MSDPQDPLAVWRNRLAPSADDLALLAEEAVSIIPDPLRSHLEGIVFQIAEFPDDDMVNELGLDSPFDLLGLYQGVSLAERSTAMTPDQPDMIFLFRRPILDYWIAEGELLDHLVRHVLIHEVGHHFGLSDDDMHALEELADRDSASSDEVARD